MPFNGSGTYVPPSLPGSFSPAISGQQATPADWNTLLADLSTALSTTITKDGQTSVTNNIPLGGFRLTNVGNATALTDATTAGQVQNARHTYAIDTGAVSAFAIAPIPACSAYQIGQSFQFKAIHSNTITNPTLAVSGLTAGVISWANGSALSAGTIVTDGLYEVIVASVTTGTPTFHLQTPIAAGSIGPTTQRLTTGTAATYTTSTTAPVKWIRVRAWGAGGGGAGCATASATQVAGTVGDDTIFNAIHAGGGGGGSTTQTIGGGGGTSATGTANLRMPGDGGENGSGPNVATAILASGGGGGPGGAAGRPAGTTAVGIAAAANSSGGGGGAYNSTGIFFNAGAGGGAGEYIEIIISNPAATYTYTIGAGGAGGVSDTNGGAGGSGLILVEEFYSF